jgi:hypothetical protein
MLRSKHRYVIVLKMYLKGILCDSVKCTHLIPLKP